MCCETAEKYPTFTFYKVVQKQRNWGKCCNNLESTSKRPFYSVIQQITPRRSAHISVKILHKPENENNFAIITALPSVLPPLFIPFNSVPK